MAGYYDTFKKVHSCLDTYNTTQAMRTQKRSPAASDMQGQHADLRSLIWMTHTRLQDMKAAPSEFKIRINGDKLAALHAHRPAFT